MKKIIMINGSPRRNGAISTAFTSLQAGLEESGAEVKEYRLNEMTFRGCQGCMGCKRKSECVLRDELTPLLEDMKSADAIVIGSPIYMYGVTGQLSMCINRMYSLIDSGYHPYYGKSRKMLSVYSMGSPVAAAYHGELTRVKRAMHRLGFQEEDCITIGGISPGKTVTSFSDGRIKKLMERGRKFAASL